MQASNFNFPGECQCLPYGSCLLIRLWPCFDTNTRNASRLTVIDPTLLLVRSAEQHLEPDSIALSYSVPHGLARDHSYNYKHTAKRRQQSAKAHAKASIACHLYQSWPVVPEQRTLINTPNHLRVASTPKGIMLKTELRPTH